MLDQMAAERSGVGRLPPVRAPGFVGRGQEMAALAGALAGSPAVDIPGGQVGQRDDLGPVRRGEHWRASASQGILQLR